MDEQMCQSLALPSDQALVHDCFVDDSTPLHAANNHIDFACFQRVAIWASTQHVEVFVHRNAPAAKLGENISLDQRYGTSQPFLRDCDSFRASPGPLLSWTRRVRERRIVDLKAWGESAHSLRCVCVCVSQWKKSQTNGKHDKRHRRYYE